VPGLVSPWMLFLLHYFLIAQLGFWIDHWAIKSKLFLKKDAIFDVNSMPRDYQIKGEYVRIWSIFGVNGRKRLQKLQSFMSATSKAI